jgi:hypothetical protein
MILGMREEIEKIPQRELRERKALTIQIMRMNGL